MPATIVRGSTAVTIHTADLWDACTCGVVHHEDVVTETTADEWFAPLPGRQHHLLSTLIADAFAKAFAPRSTP